MDNFLRGVTAVFWTLVACVVLAVATCSYVAFADEAPETWCGLKVEPENRCSAYERAKDYSYNASVEWRIVERDGYTADKRGWLDRPYPSPYMRNVKIRSIRDTDIEHIVAAAEAHDSGLCRADKATRTAFARDLDNLTISLPSVNRYEKVDKDAAEWLPEKRRRWYAETVVHVKRKYGLSIDSAERDALATILPHCGKE